jgi:hypothetical protein
MLVDANDGDGDVVVVDNVMDSDETCNDGEGRC